MNERIKKVRKALDLTQRDFGVRIGTTQNAIANYETGHRNPSSAVIDNICKTFNVNETWLRTGEGEMFRQTEEDATSRLCAEMHASELEAGIIRAYFRIDPKIRDAFMSRLIEEVQTEYSAETPTKPPREMTDAELHAELDRQLAEEREKASQASTAKESGLA